MKRVLIAFLSITIPFAIVAAGGDEKEKNKEEARFTPGPPESYKNHQKGQGLVIAAAPFVDPEPVRSAFGKLNPNDHGILPVLVLIQNNTGKALSIQPVVRLTDPMRRSIESTPAGDLQYLRSPKQPKIVEESRLPRIGNKKQKSPLAAWEIEGRSFSVRMIPAGETVSGFFYFQTRFLEGSSLYLSGIRDAQTGKEFFYVELPLEKQ